MDEEQLNPTQLQLLPWPRQHLADYTQKPLGKSTGKAWDPKASPQRGTPAPATSIQTQGKRPKGEVASQGDLSPAPLSPGDLRGAASDKQEQSLARGLPGS